MFCFSRQGVSAYAQVGVETGVLAASPHKLISMLYEGAVTAVDFAAVHMEAGEIEKKGEAISKAVSIILVGLRSCLNKEAGGDLAESLDSLYDYMARRLFEANIKNDQAMLAEVRALLIEIKGAWDEIGDNAESRPAVAVEAVAMQRPGDALSPRTVTQMRA